MRTRTQEHVTEDATVATPEPFDVIVRNEGGPSNPDNIKAALNYCRMCLKLGGRWVHYNNWTKRIEFVYQKKRMTQIWRDKWSMQRVEQRAIKGKNAEEDSSIGYAWADAKWKTVESAGGEISEQTAKSNGNDDGTTMKDETHRDNRWNEARSWSQKESWSLGRSTGSWWAAWKEHKASRKN